MNRRTLLALVSSVALAALVRSSGFSFAQPAPATGAAQTQAIVDATTAFLTALDPEQRRKVRFPFDRPPTATAARFKGGRGAT